MLVSRASCAFLQVALVGAPNVGKSSLVQLLSSGLPEVQNYPFTTRSIKMGHFYVAGRRHQVTGGLCRGCKSDGVYCVSNISICTEPMPILTPIPMVWYDTAMLRAF
jgi:ribosome-binding ATPase YchF (GTP1/OBG family)